MIHVLCSGGLGNQMFQYAYLKHLSRFKKNVILDTSFYLHNKIHSGYSLDKAFGISGYCNKDHFKPYWRMCYSIMSKINIKKLGAVFMELEDEIIDEKKIRNNSILYGYWQGEQFFYDAREEVKQDFSFIGLSDATISLAKNMKTENSLAVHIRRGDYLKNSKYVNLSSTDYYKNALIRSKEYIDDPKIYVFSDDILWCKESGLFNDETKYVDFNTGDHSYEDMFLMSQAKGIIIANSSFSWWSGYLGHHQFVIRPEKYLVNWSRNQDERLFPKNWIVEKLEGNL